MMWHLHRTRITKRNQTTPTHARPPSSSSSSSKPVGTTIAHSPFRRFTHSPFPPSLSTPTPNPKRRTPSAKRQTRITFHFSLLTFHISFFLQSAPPRFAPNP